MKLLFLFIASCLFTINMLAKDYQGYYIDNDGNKVEATFKVSENFYTQEPNFVKITRGVKYSVNGKAKKLRPKDCKSIVFLLPDEEIRFISMPNKYFPELGSLEDSIFIRPKIVGPVNMYYCYFRHSSFNGSTASSTPALGWIVEKQDGKFLKILYTGSKKNQLIEFFNDYPELADNIKREQINGDGITIMVEDYNRWFHERIPTK